MIACPRERSLYIHIGARVREARKARGMKQGALAECIGLTRTSIINLERGRQAVPLRELLDIAEWLDVEPCWLLLGDA